MASTNPSPPSAFARRLWGAHVLMVVFVAGAVALGLWQYNSSQDHKEDQIKSLVHADPVSLTGLMGPNDPLLANQVGRPVTFHGIWLPDDTIFINGQTHQGVVGYWAVTPVLVDGKQPRSAVYVVRGWTEDPGTAPPAPRGHVSLTGWMQPSVSYSGGYRPDYMADDRPTDNIVPQVDVSSLIQRVDYDLYSAYVIRADHETGWPKASLPVNDGSTDLASVPAPKHAKADPGTGLRNLLYAVEWWLFGVFGVYVWWRWVRDVTNPDEDDADDRDDGDSGVDDTPAASDEVPENDAQESTVGSDA